MSSSSDAADYRRAAGVAKRKNSENRRKAPLLEWAGLVDKVTPEQVLQRRRLAQNDAFWTSLRQAESHAVGHALADWLRYVVWSLVPEDVFDETQAWADNVRGPYYCRVVAWKQASDRALRGESPLPESATISPTACWASLRAACMGGTFKQEAQRHTDAGCTAEHCEVSGDDRPAPINLGQVWKTSARQVSG